MTIDHIAIWTNDLERMRAFYQKYFNLSCGKKYVNNKKGFASYFLSFKKGARLEIMTRNDIGNESVANEIKKGLIHFAISVGSKEAVDKITEQLRSDGFKIFGEPRTTGDGYYESVIADPDGNQIELTE